LGQPVIVENKPGASGNIAADLVAKATDDHTLGVVINGNLTSARILNPKLPFDPRQDFSFLSLLTTAPLMLVAPAGQPDGAAFFKAAQSQGDKWSYASPGNGTVAHLGMEWLKAKAGGLRAVHVPYASNPQLLTAMLGGQIQMALVPPGIAMPHVRSGKLQAIGLTTSGRSVLVPEVPPLSDAGLKDFTLEVWTALIGPARLSTAAQQRLLAEVSPIVRSPETRQRLFSQGWQAVGSSPEGLKKRVESETKVLGDIITRQSIQTE
jgi:tripartite-type tricarboxylate transporter receptor subunit TctC